MDTEGLRVMKDLVRHWIQQWYFKTHQSTYGIDLVRGPFPVLPQPSPATEHSMALSPEDSGGYWCAAVEHARPYSHRWHQEQKQWRILRGRSQRDTNRSVIGKCKTPNNR